MSNKLAEMIELDTDRWMTALRCEVCKEPTSPRQGGCTNGRCRDCHARWCSTGGGTSSPGHGRRWPTGESESKKEV